MTSSDRRVTRNWRRHAAPVAAAVPAAAICQRRDRPRQLGSPTAVFRWVAAAGCTASVLAACSGAPTTRVQLPGRPLATHMSAPKPVAVSYPAPLTPRQQVVAALTGYTAALGEADRSGSVAMARQLLQPYLVASRIDGLVQAMSSIWAKGESFFGQDELHILSVRIDGQHAFAHDCDNTSAMGLKNDATGQPVPGSAGVPRDNLVTRLNLVDGHWLVAFQIVEDLPCAP